MASDPAIRVLYVINGLGTGGAERSLAELVRPLRELRVDLAVAYLHERDEGVKAEMPLPDEHMFHVGPSALTAILRIRALIRKLEPDLIHTTIFESDIAGRLASIGTGVPVLTSLVNTSYSRSGSSNPDVSELKLAMVRAIDSFSARLVNRGFHALTQAAKEDNVAALGLDRARVEVVPRGRSETRLGRRSSERRERVRISLDLPSDVPTLLSVGRREHQKGQIYAVEAMPKVLQSHPGAILLIAGRDGSAGPRIENRTRELNLTASVRILGHRGDVPDLMVASDVLVFPSLYEGFGGTLIEAMALELPIVTTDLDVTREVLGDSAFFARRGSAADVASGVVRILEDEAFASSLTQRGRSRYERNFRIESVAAATAEMYRRVLKAEPAAPPAFS